MWKFLDKHPGTCLLLLGLLVALIVGAGDWISTHNWTTQPVVAEETDP